MARFADRITGAPIPHDAERGAEAVEGFAPPLNDLIAGAAGCSGYLARLLTREDEWIRVALDGNPEDAFDALMAAQPEGESLAELGVFLRQSKRRVALLTALADLGGVWSLEQVTGALTKFADRAVAMGLSHLVAAAVAKGRLPATEAKDGGVAVLAMGKMGAEELNYSSDIDLILLFDELAYAPEDFAAARSGLIRVTQSLVKLLSEITGEGYVFRTDLRLRPNPSSTPVCMGMEAAERYYETHGRAWERAAHIKTRVAAGDMEAGAGFLEAIRPFVWRKNLDYAAIEEVHDLRQKIRTHRGQGSAILLPGHNVKLGHGGIRQIEFFAQTAQMIFGGRDPGLRDPRTMTALKLLAEREHIDAATAAILAEDYRALRGLEHRLQMIDDAQTHSLPKSEEGLALVADFCGAADHKVFWANWQARFERVHRLTEAFFAPTVPAAPRNTEPDWSGFEDPKAAAALAEGWRHCPALRTERARRLFRRLEPVLVERLSRAGHPDEALRHFDAFLTGLPAGIQVLALFDANPQLLELLVDICALAPGLASYLGRNASVLDAVIGNGFFTPLPDLTGYRAGLADAFAALGREPVYEDYLDAARRWNKEAHFRIGVHLLRGVSTVDEAARAYADLAEATVACLLPAVEAEVARRYGAAPGDGVAVLGMGKLGARSMTASSDLDLIVVYDAAGDAMSEGRKPLSSAPYFARFTQTLVASLSAATAEGKIYEVDMRLRPSGRQGPVATSLSSFADYQKNRAWTWEHLALTRARVVAATGGAKAKVEAAIAVALDRPRKVAAVSKDVQEMRARLAEAEPGGEWTLRQGPGRILDIELCVQAGLLITGTSGPMLVPDMLKALVPTGWISAEGAAVLERAHRLFSDIQQLCRASDSEKFDPAAVGQGMSDLVLERTGCADLDALSVLMSDMAAAAVTVIERQLGDAG